MVLPHLKKPAGSKEPKALPAEQSVYEDFPSGWLGLCPASGHSFNFAHVLCSGITEWAEEQGVSLH